MTDGANYPDWSERHPESRFTHAQCDDCWFRTRHTMGERPLVPGGKAVLSIEIPSRLVEPEWDRCCFCGHITRSGIYVRSAPEAATHCLKALERN